MRLTGKPTNNERLLVAILSNKGRLPESMWEGTQWITPNQIHAILMKWVEADRWDYGVSVRAGWLCTDGEAVFK